MVILLKNASSLSISTKLNKNWVLTNTIWNLVNPIGVSRITDLIDIVVSIPNIKLIDGTVFLSSETEVSSYFHVFDWLMPPVDWVGTFESMSNPLDLVSLYYESVDKLET